VIVLISNNELPDLRDTLNKNDYPIHSDIIVKCLNPEPSSRPSFETLVEIIRSNYPKEYNFSVDEM